MQTKTIPFDLYDMTSMDVYMDSYDNVWLVGEVDGDTTSFDTKEIAQEAYNDVKDTKSFCSLMGWK